MLFNFHETWKVEPLLTDEGARRIVRLRDILSSYATGNWKYILSPQNHEIGTKTSRKCVFVYF